MRRAEERDAERASREEIARDELETRLRESREERARLRDRCDELGAALEVAGATRLAREGAARCWRDEVDAQAPDSLPDVRGLLTLTAYRIRRSAVRFTIFLLSRCVTSRCNLLIRKMPRK